VDYKTVKMTRLRCHRCRRNQVLGRRGVEKMDGNLGHLRLCWYGW